MTGGPAGTFSPSRAARLAHGGLLLTPVGFFLLAILLYPSLDRPGPVTSPLLLRWGGLGLGAILVAVAALLRGTLPVRRSEEPEDAWWQANLPRVMMLWSLAEAVGVAGAAVSIVAGDVLGAAPLVVASTALLLHLAPARLARA